MDNDDKYVAAKLEGAGLEMAPKVLELLRSTGISESCYANKLRVKNEAKLLEKKARKLADKPDYALHRITDVFGLRLVTLFKADMVSVFNAVVSAIAHRNGVSPNPFLANSLEEVIIFNGTTMIDELPLQIREQAEKLVPGINVAVKNSPEGYSSIHLVCRLDKRIDCLSSGTKVYMLPIEIQIRTVFEDAWGEIDHKYGYVIRSGKDVGVPINNPDYVLAHLRVLKRFADACMEYADCIREEAANPVPVVAVPSTVISVDADDELISRLRELAVSNEYLAGYEKARGAKLVAAQKRLEDKKQGDQMLLDVAEKFRELAESCGGGECQPELGLGDRLAVYYARMNEAVCLMSIGTKEMISTALHVYKHLELHFPNFPLLKMRIGQAYGKLGQTELAISKIRESGDIADKIIQTRGDWGNGWPDEFPRVDYEHFRKSQPKLLGYYIWNKVQNQSDDDHAEKSRLFYEAYTVTQPCLSSIQAGTTDMLSIRNNLLYYAIGYLTHANAIGLPVAKDLATEMIDHLKYIEQFAPDTSTLDLDTLDTVVKAYAYTGHSKEAKKLAEILIDRCLADTDFGDSEIKISLIRDAREIVQTGQLASFD